MANYISHEAAWDNVGTTLDAQSPSQSRNPVPPQFVGKNFRKGLPSPNPGGRLPSKAHTKVVDDLIAELGREPSASEAVIIDTIAKARTNPRYVCPAATIGRLMRQLGLPKKPEPPPEESLWEYCDRKNREEAESA